MPRSNQVFMNVRCIDAALSILKMVLLENPAVQRGIRGMDMPGVSISANGSISKIPYHRVLMKDVLGPPFRDFSRMHHCMESYLKPLDEWTWKDPLLKIKDRCLPLRNRHFCTSKTKDSCRINTFPSIIKYDNNILLLFKMLYLVCLLT